MINKSCALKIKLDPMDFDYFTSVVRSDDDSRLDSVLYEPRRRPKHSKKITPNDFIDEKVNDVIKSSVNPYEFSMLVVQLLTSLCRSEHSFTISAGKLVETNEMAIFGWLTVYVCTNGKKEIKTSGFLIQKYPIETS